jgi:regulator of RNase E activity RraA
VCVVLLHDVRSCQSLSSLNRFIYGNIEISLAIVSSAPTYTLAIITWEVSVKQRYTFAPFKRLFPSLLVCLLAVTVLSGRSALYFLKTHAANAANPANDDLSLLDAYRHVEVASVSDALEKISGHKMYMSHRMRPIFGSKFAGFALTVQLKKDPNNDPRALDGMLAAIDQGGANSVYVMALEDGVDIAGMGGLMGTAMSARGFSGAVIDGGVRDVAYLTKIGFPVYALGIVPSTSVGHYRFAGANIPVVCDGVAVNAGDIIVADTDGVTVVPRAQAPQVLALAQEMDFKEHSMDADIEKLKSIQEAVKKFGRL